MTLSSFWHPSPQNDGPAALLLISILGVIASVAAAYAKGAIG